MYACNSVCPVAPEDEAGRSQIQSQSPLLSEALSNLGPISKGAVNVALWLNTLGFNPWNKKKGKEKENSSVIFQCVSIFMYI